MISSIRLRLRSMMWLALLACTSLDSGDSVSGDSVSDTSTHLTDSATSSPVTGTLEVSLRAELVTEATITGTFEGGPPLTLSCQGAGDHQVPETHRWSTPDSAQTHTAILNGLLPETEYTCTADGLDNIEPVSFTTGPLPEDLQVHVMTLRTWDPGAETGWTLVNPFRFETLQRHREAYLVVLDMEGRVRWYYATNQDGIVAFDYNPAAEAFWTGGGLTDIYEPTAINLDATVRHVTSSKADHDVHWFGDDAWALVKHPAGTCIERRRWTDDTLVGSLCTHTLGLEDLHLNSLDVEAVDDGHVIYAGTATSNTIVKMHFEREELVWVFGPNHDFNGTIVVDYTHDVNMVPCTDHEVCISFYDNGDTAKHSEAEIFGLNESNRIAVQLRQWSEPGWFEPRMGGLQVLEGGNLLIGSGHLEMSVPDSSSTAVIEVDPDDNVVWRLEIAPDTSAIYRARRIAPCDLFGHTGYCPSLSE